MTLRSQAKACATLALLLMGAQPSEPRYPSPAELALSSDGGRLFVVCEGTDEVLSNWLGYDGDKIAQLRAAGAL